MIRDRIMAPDLAAAFLFLHDLFRAPGPEQWTWLTAPGTVEFRRQLCAALELPPPADDPGLPGELQEYEAQYIAAFDAGAPHPPVPLLESHYNRRDPVPRVLHENILFHKAFGLRLRSEANETADHLRHQLEFIAHLFRLEAQGTGVIPEQTRQGRQEFLERHVLSWLPEAVRKAEDLPFLWLRRNLALTLAVSQAAGARNPESDSRCSTGTS